MAKMKAIQVLAKGEPMTLVALRRYQPHGGRLHERAIVARHLAARGLKTGANRVLTVDAAQHGLAITCMGLLKPGDVTAADYLTHSGMKVLAEALHLELAAVPATAEGPDLDFLQQLCKRRRIRAVYVQPTVHNGSGANRKAG